MSEMKLLKFSVIMCVYYADDAGNFDIAVESIVNQTYQPSEIVLVVDGPVGAELNGVILKWKDLYGYKFIIVRLEKNHGLGYARRVALAHTNYDIVAIMDADDISMSNRFELQLKYLLEHSDISVVGGNIKEFDDLTGEKIAYRIVPEKDEDIKKFLKMRNPINNMTVMAYKSDILEVGGFKDFYLMEDYYLWARMCSAGKKFYNIQAVLVNVRSGKDMYKRRGGIKLLQSEIKMQKYMYDSNIIPLYLFVCNMFIRVVVQIILPTNIRGVFYRLFARDKAV